jgi:hypothetical protein
MELRAKHVWYARLIPQIHADFAIVVMCPACHAEGAMVVGDQAATVLRQGLTYLNATREGRRRAEAAARAVDQAGGSEHLIRDVASRETLIHSIGPELRLALEIAVDEQAEVQDLEKRWREAEEIAEIADGMLSSTPELEERLRRLRDCDKSQPHS